MTWHGRPRRGVISARHLLIESCSWKLTANMVAEALLREYYVNGRIFEIFQGWGLRVLHRWTGWTGFLGCGLYSDGQPDRIFGLRVV